VLFPSDSIWPGVLSSQKKHGEERNYMLPDLCDGCLILLLGTSSNADMPKRVTVGTLDDFISAGLGNFQIPPTHFKVNVKRT